MELNVQLSTTLLRETMNLDALRLGVARTESESEYEVKVHLTIEAQTAHHTNVASSGENTPNT